MNVKISRNGDKYAREALLPYLVRQNAKNAGDQWQIDGTRFQFLFEDQHGKIGFLTLFVVLDVYSKKIVGFSLDDQENTRMIFQALQQACNFTGHLPTEIVHDNFSVYSTKEFKNLVEHSSLMGVKWRPTSLGNSCDKGHVERFFQTFQSVICKTVDGYIGEGIRSKRENGHPAPHLIDQYRKREHIRDRQGLILLADELLFRYNDTVINEESPNSKYEKSEKKNVISLTPCQTSALFWKKKLIKVHRSMIKISVNKQDYRYTIWDTILSRKINTTYVIVRYNEKEMERIYIFDEADHFLCEVSEDIPIPVASVNQTEEDKIRIRKFARNRKSIISSAIEMARQERELLTEYDIETLNPETAPKWYKSFPDKENNSC